METISIVLIVLWALTFWLIGIGMKIIEDEMPIICVIGAPIAVPILLGMGFMAWIMDYHKPEEEETIEQKKQKEYDKIMEYRKYLKEQKY